MKWIPDETSRFRYRLDYSYREIDVIYERRMLTFLSASHGCVAFPVDTEDLKKLIESDIEDLDQFFVFDQTDIEGATEWFPDQLPRVKIVSWLSESPTYENRLRSTITHEHGHVLLHTALFKRPYAHDGGVLKAS